MKGGSSMSVDANRAVTQRFYEEVWNNGNLDAVDDIMTGNFVDHAAPPGFPSGPEGAKQVFTMYRSAFPDFRLNVWDLIAEGDKVVARWSTQGTHQGELMGIPPTGKRVEVTGIDIFRFAEGKIAEHWAEFDMLGLMQQLGVIPAPGQVHA
jgi:steroid delta-isomerase-like uncharacterized protein